MRFRTLIASLAAVAGLLSPLPAQAAPIVLVAGPLLSPGHFSEEGMHPVFTACSFPTLGTPTSTTVVTFVIRKSTHDAYFQVTNSCGTYDEAFDFTECEREGTLWDCRHTRPDGVFANAQLGVVDGRTVIYATEYNQDLSRFWTVSGGVVLAAE